MLQFGKTCYCMLVHLYMAMCRIIQLAEIKQRHKILFQHAMRCFVKVKYSMQYIMLNGTIRDQALAIQHLVQILKVMISAI